MPFRTPDNPILRDNENDTLRDSGLDPSQYGVLVAQASTTGQPIQEADVTTPHGNVRCYLIPTVILIPTQQIAPRIGILDANGNAPNPLEGMLSTFETRVVIPIKRIKRELNVANKPMKDA